MDIALLSLAILLGFTVQTTIGFAGGLISLPIILLTYDLKEAVALVSVFNFIFSIKLLTKVWPLIDKAVYKELAVATILGVVAGVAVLMYGKPVFLKRLLGFFTICYVFYSLSSKEEPKSFGNFGYLFGFTGGFFAGLFSSGAPPFVIYLNSKYKDPKILRASIIGALALTNVARLLLLIVEGVYTEDIIWSCLWILPTFIISLFLGQFLSTRVSATRFKKLVQAFLILAGLSLLLT